MKRMLLLTLILILPVVFSPANISADWAMDQLVDRILSAYGGKKVDSVHAYRMEGTVEAKMRNTRASMVRLFSRPDRLYVDLAYQVNPERRYLDAGKGWRTIPGNKGIREVHGPLLKSMVLQAARSNIPWILAQHREKVTQLPALRVGKNMTFGLRIPLEPGLEIRLYGDPKTALIVYSQAILKSGKINTRFETAYSDFREVGGVLFPHHEENWASGAHTGATEIQKITVNPPLEKNSFRPGK